MSIFQEIESEVRSYSRNFPTTFKKALGSRLYDEAGKSYIDFFAGAGSLNYGHNPPQLTSALIDHLNENGIVHGLDMQTSAKERFLEVFKSHILRPRGLEYKLQFPGPTGTNAVESAIKVARKVTGRTKIMTFTNAFHGMTLGSLALTGNNGKRAGSGLSLDGAYFMPYDGFHGDNVDTLQLIRQYLNDPSSGYEKPAAVIVETVQGEGGVNAASFEWLKGLQSICREHDIVFIIDDIQVGCGRTGSFFSFEEANLNPDIVCLSKSLSGYGLPFALTLIRPEMDIWKPGEHNGTFRGNNMAFVTATEAIIRFWADTVLQEQVKEKSRYMQSRLDRIAEKRTDLHVKGRGMILGLEFSAGEEAEQVSKACFENGLILETAGSHDQVVKFLPPLTTAMDEIEAGMNILENVISQGSRKQ